MKRLVVFVAACGGSHPASIDAAIADVEIDAAVATWAPPVTLSDPANASFVPAIATRGTRVVIAWHDFPAGGGASRLLTRTIADGTLGPIVPIAETTTGPKRPAIAATTAGFVLAWDAVDTSGSVIRTIDLDADGNAIGTPVTISTATGSTARVAAHGDDVAFAWTDGNAHFFARRGPVETVAATPVGTTLMSTGLINFPRVAIASSGAITIAYRDGDMPSNFEVLLVTRPTGGAFASPVDVSNSVGLLSDDIALATEPDDTLDLVWVDEAIENVNNFETEHATRSPAGVLTAPVRFGTQGTMAWTPSVAVGGAAAWHTGGGAGGDLWLALPGSGPQPILPGEQGGAVALARSDDAALQLAYVTLAAPRQIRYTIRR